MKNLEDIIRENKDKFNDREPREGHIDRFQEKLERYHKKTKKPFLNWGFALKAAAIGILVVLSSLWLYDQLYTNQLVEHLAQREESKEVQEVQLYYSNLVEKKYNQIQDFNFKNEQQKKMLLEELSTMDSIYYNIKQDYKEHPNDPRVLNTLIRHYQMKLDVMNQVLEQLNQVKAIKNKNNNKNNKDYETKKL